jgi:hypothetical protein
MFLDRITRTGREAAFRKCASSVLESSSQKEPTSEPSIARSSVLGFHSGGLNVRPGEGFSKIAARVEMYIRSILATPTGLNAAQGPAHSICDQKPHLDRKIQTGGAGIRAYHTRLILKESAGL